MSWASQLHFVATTNEAIDNNQQKAMNFTFSSDLQQLKFLCQMLPSAPNYGTTLHTSKNNSVTFC